jgi:hypothetical protein
MEHKSKENVEVQTKTSPRVRIFAPMNKTSGRWMWPSAGAALTAYVALRAARLSFTHDEALSYNIVLGDTHRAQTANHHYLNTWAMDFCSGLFGVSEGSLRAGSVFAFVLYLAAVFYLLSELRHTGIRILGFVLLCLNPFLLDFFGLARGYSWALAGVAGMLLAFWKLSADKGNSTQGTAWVRFGLASSALALLGNLSVLSAVLPFWGVLLLLWIKRGFSPRPVFSLQNGLFIAGYAALLKFVFEEAFRLKERGELYYGGRENFVSDTLRSLINPTLYAAPYGPGVSKIVLYTILASALVLIFGALRNWFGSSRPDAYTLLGTLLGGSVALILAQHHLLDTPLPLDRAAAYLIPMFAATLIAAFDPLTDPQRTVFLVRGLAVFAVGIAALATVHFVRTANLTHCFMWQYDQNTKTALEQVAATRTQQPPDKKTTLTAHALFEPAAHFYKRTKGYDWLELVEKKDGQAQKTDLYYTLWDDFANLPEKEGLREVVHFDDTKSTLWKR